MHNKVHLGLSKTFERAPMCMYWPGITDAIKDSVSACKAFLNFSSKQQREPYVSDIQTKPWSHLSLDNFKFHGAHFLMVLDTATKFCVIWSVPSLNTETMIQTLTSMFSEHGMPLSIKCDWGISLSLSSAYHHSINPAERAIRTIKGLMKHCTMAKQSWRLALIEYLATPLGSNTPPPSELNRHQFFTAKCLKFH